jgi:hypothetical protein
MLSSHDAQYQIKQQPKRAACLSHAMRVFLETTASGTDTRRAHNSALRRLHITAALLQGLAERNSACLHGPVYARAHTYV